MEKKKIGIKGIVNLFSCDTYHNYPAGKNWSPEPPEDIPRPTSSEHPLNIVFENPWDFPIRHPGDTDILGTSRFDVPGTS